MTGTRKDKVTAEKIVVVNTLLTTAKLSRSMSHYAALPRQFWNTINRLFENHTAHRRPLAAIKVLRDLAKQHENVLAYFRTGDPAIAARLRENLGLSKGKEPCPIPADLFGPSQKAETQPATILIPVHNGYNDVNTLLHHLPETLSGGESIILIDDASTDARVRSLLQDFSKGKQGCELHRLPRNLGFVGAVNHGFRVADANAPVILLNTDALPPKGWVPRLLAPLEDPSVASCTPVSDTAENLTIPGHVTPLSFDAICQIDKTAKSFASEHHHIEIPTGIGFCMAMSPLFLRKIKSFDTAFGRGYGEEVDWCQKTRTLGGRHVAVTNIFVAHRGGGSFGDEKQERLNAASRLISERYPQYDNEVATWAREDPIAPQRFALAIARMAATTTTALPILIGHRLGGGAELSLQLEVKHHLDQGLGAIVIRPGGRMKWDIEAHLSGETLSASVESNDLLHRLLDPIVRRYVIYSCGVGAIDPAAIPRLLLQLSNASQRMDLRLHDYFPISPSYCLLSDADDFQGVPATDDSSNAHRLKRIPGREAVTHGEWRKLWDRVIDQCREVTTYSRSSQKLFHDASPQHQCKTALRPHMMEDLPEAIKPGGQAIGVLGGINLAKGGRILRDLAPQLRRQMIVVGELDSQFSLPKPHKVHGKYERRDISKLAIHYEIGAWFIPSIWPETFSFTTREALATGLPVFTFPLGAQAEAAKEAPNGYLLSSPPYDAKALASEIESSFTEVTSRDTP